MLREPVLALDGQLRVKAASPGFTRDFQVSTEETLGRHIYELGNGQWNIPQLRTLLEEILTKQTSLEDFKVEHKFERIGRRTMLLNARRIEQDSGAMIWLAIKDVTG